MKADSKNKYFNQREASSYKLLLNLTDQLKNSLLQISKSAETSIKTGLDKNLLIKSTSDYTVELLNAYSLGLKMAFEETDVSLEPISISAVLYSTAKKLATIAKNYNVDIDLNISGKNNLIISNYSGLETSLITLGYSMIESLPSTENKQMRIYLASHMCRYGLVAGIYADDSTLTNESLKKGRKLYGMVRQPLTGFSHTASSGIFLADNILNNLNLKLKTSQHRHLRGLGIVLEPIPQLQLTI